MSDQQFRTEGEALAALERANDIALGYLERLSNAWVGKGLPMGVLARAMMGFGLTCIEGGEGRASAGEVLEGVTAQFKENGERQSPAH